MQACYKTGYLIDVPNDCFDPPPKVQSGIILIQRKTTAPDHKSVRASRLLVKVAFNQGRKTMCNAVKSFFPAGVMQDEIFLKPAEAWSMEEFAALIFRLS